MARRNAGSPSSAARRRSAIIAAFAYELVRFGARNYGNPVVRAIYAPGLWLQSLTTRPPDHSMPEVSIASLESCVASDREAKAAAPAPGA